MASLRAIALLTCLLATIGCRSPYIEATVTNQTGQPISLIEVDYPYASFGVQSIAPGGDFSYRFQTRGSDNLKITYTTSTNTIKKATGPVVKDGQEGYLKILVGPNGVNWKFTPGKHV
jgi:hypothetical protein